MTVMKVTEAWAEIVSNADLQAMTHQANFKELVLSDQKATLEHTAQTTAACKLTSAWEELAVYISRYQK